MAKLQRMDWLMGNGLLVVHPGVIGMCMKKPEPPIDPDEVSDGEPGYEAFVDGDGNVLPCLMVWFDHSLGGGYVMGQQIVLHAERGKVLCGVWRDHIVGKPGPGCQCISVEEFRANGPNKRRQEFNSTAEYLAEATKPWRV